MIPSLPQDYFDILSNMLVALGAGALIGFERSYQGRPAGFRTHMLVCMASALLMTVTLFQHKWFPGTGDVVRLDPTRMAQGIMTGIGFLGAGVIVKEGAAVRGLTTAGSIWITAAIGILAGIGFYFPLVLTTVLTLGTLSVFRFLEARMAVLHYLQHNIVFAAASPIDEQEYRALVESLGFSVSSTSYSRNALLDRSELSLIISTRDPANTRQLAATLTRDARVLEFGISPVGD